MAGVLAGVAIADQAIKAIVTSGIERGESVSVVLGIDLVNVRNSGVAFGALQDGGAIVSVIIALAVCALLAYFTRNAEVPWIWLPTGMLLGGALGNVIDRVREGAVIDFLKLPFWPAFNLADATITVGVVLLLVAIERGHGDRGPG